MLDPTNSETDANRVALLPLDCSHRSLQNLLGRFDREKPVERLGAYGFKAVEGIGEPAKPPLVNKIYEIAIFSAFTAVRVEFADPLPGTIYYEQFPENSSERRMMERPLRNHPGLSRFTRDVRDQYVYNILYTFQNLLDNKFQQEIVAILAAPDAEWLSSSDGITRAYQLPSTELKELRNQVTRYDDGFMIPRSHLSRRNLLEPLGDLLYMPSEFEDLPPITRRNDGIVIPEDVILAKLANYAWHGWYRIVHVFYNMTSEDFIEDLVNLAPEIGDEIKDHLQYRRPKRSFFPYYGSDTQNPLVDSNVGDPMHRPDKRLVTVADTIRASSNLEFSEQIPITQLFHEICQFFPSPDRPSNDVSTEQTLTDALNGSRDDRISSVGDNPVYEIPSPKPTPFLPHPSDGKRFWTQYRHELSDLARNSANLPDAHRISPVMPDNWRPQTSAEYKTARQKTDQAAVTKMKYDASRLGTVKPFVDPDEFNALSADELLFLTRIGLAMERRIKSYSLVDSMKNFDKTGEEKLTIDFERLEDQNYLKQLPGRRTYYSIPHEIRRRLGIPNVSHDGWGERSPSEGTLHRVGIDLSALIVAAQPGIDRVVRYCDAWRLKNTTYWDAVSHLENKRLDVIGFADGEPQIVCEVETQSGGKTDTVGAVKKIAAFPATVDRLFVAPNGDHLQALMSRLVTSGYVDIDFGDPKDGGYRPADVRNKLAEHGTIDEKFDELLTYDNIRTQLPNSSDRRELSDKIIGSI